MAWPRLTPGLRRRSRPVSRERRRTGSRPCPAGSGPATKPCRVAPTSGSLRDPAGWAGAALGQHRARAMADHLGLTLLRPGSLQPTTTGGSISTVATAWPSRPAASVRRPPRLRTSQAAAARSRTTGPPPKSSAERNGPQDQEAADHEDQQQRDHDHLLDAGLRVHAGSRDDDRRTLAHSAIRPTAGHRRAIVIQRPGNRAPDSDRAGDNHVRHRRSVR